MRHHFIPQFLQRAWADTNPDKHYVVFRLDLPGIPSQRTVPKAAGYLPDLWKYTRPLAPGMDPHQIEKVVFGKIDHDAALVHQKLLNRDLHLTNEERNSWRRFIASLRLRQPHVIQHHRAESERLLRADLRQRSELFDELREINDPETLEEWTERKLPGLIENFGLTFLHDVIEDEKSGAEILNMKWWVWDFSKVPFTLLLSDQPCTISTDLNDPNAIFALPISPTKAFFAAREGRAADALRQRKARDLAERLNGSSLGEARARVFAKDENCRRFIENRVAKAKALGAKRAKAMDESR